MYCSAISNMSFYDCSFYRFTVCCPLQVETSLQSSFQPGMKLEVANKGGGGGGGGDTYWVATIITTCGQLLLLRYSGYGDDRKADFWCDVMTAELHPVGWCAAHNKTLMPPEGTRRNCTHNCLKSDGGSQQLDQHFSSQDFFHGSQIYYE